MKKLIKVVGLAFVAVAFLYGCERKEEAAEALQEKAIAKKVLRIQSVLSTSADEVVMLREFGKDVAALTSGSLTIEVLPAGAVVGP